MVFSEVFLPFHKIKTTLLEFTKLSCGFKNDFACLEQRVSNMMKVSSIIFFISLNDFVNKSILF